MHRGTGAGSLAASYLVGAFPTAELVSRARGRDVHHEGSGNPGATNTYRIAGAPAAALVLAVDMCKGAVATWVGKKIDPGGPLGPACGVAAVLGHCFPPGKTGGKGVATAGGLLLALDPPLALTAAATWAALAKATRRASLASIGVAALMPVAAAALRRPRTERRALAAVAVVVAARHRDNLARLRRGDEPELPRGG